MSRSFRETAKSVLDLTIHTGLRIASIYGVRTAYERLLAHVQQHTDLLQPRRKCGDRPGNTRCQLNVGLLALALHEDDWLRPVENWMPPNAGSWCQFRSLAEHLLTNYPVPEFMASAWFELPFGRKQLHHEWYKRLGLGQSIRSCNLPMKFSKRMVHWFNQAPHHLSVVQGIRWAQVRGLGGTKELAVAVASTRLGKVLEHEDFWLTVLQFFLRNPKMDLVHVGPIVDFLQYQRFEPCDGIVRQQGPPQPNYSMEGRTLRSMLRQVEEWHYQLGLERAAVALRWNRCRIGEFVVVDGHEHLGNLRRWSITELLTDQDLFEEGRTLRHCVATYTKRCHMRQTSIWSLRMENDHGIHPVLSIEVDPVKRTICQARGRCNRMPKDHEKEIMRRWAAKEGLRLGV